jgi:protocatechuate 3,4-dioxygenase beta subunit
MRRLWIGVSAAATIGVAWWVLRGGEGPPVDFEHEGGARERAAASRSTTPPAGPSPVAVVSEPFVDAPESAPAEPAAEAEVDAGPVCAIVLRHDGAPAAGVRAAFTEDDATFDSFGVNFSIYAQADELGRVRLPRSLQAPGNDSTQARPWKAIVCVVGLTTAASPSFSPSSRGSPPTEVRLPPTVATNVVLKRADGTPYLGEAVVVAEPTADGPGEHEARDFETLSELSSDRAAFARTTSGSVVFPYVACGAETTFFGAPSAATERPGRATWTAPTAPGEPTTIELTMGLSGVVIVGRAVDGRGKPRARANLRIQPHETTTVGAPSMFGAFEAPTPSDEDGRFLKTFDFDPARFRATSTRVLLARGFGAGADVVVNVAHGPPDASGRLDLGDVALPDPAVFCRGKVIDESGAPVPDARIGMRIRRDATSSESDEFYWSDGYLRVSTKADGTFELEGPPPSNVDGRLFLRAAHKSFVLVELVPLDLNAPVVVRMSRGGGLKGSILGGSTSGAAERIEVVVSGDAVREAAFDDVDPSDATARVVDVRPLGDFELGGLRPGRATVAFRVRGSDAPLHVVPDVEVVAGPAVEDPRLKDVDLSRFFGVVRVTVRDEDGRPVTDARVCAYADGAYRWTHHEVDENGVASIPKIGAPALIVATAPGRAGRDLGRPDADVVAVLTKAIECRLAVVLPADVELPPAPYGLSAALTWRGEADDDAQAHRPYLEALQPDPPGSSFGVDRTYSCVVRTPGAYSLQVYFTRNDGDSRTAFSLGEAATVVVSKADAKLDVEASFPRARLDELLKQARGK